MGFKRGRILHIGVSKIPEIQKSKWELILERAFLQSMRKLSCDHDPMSIKIAGSIVFVALMLLWCAQSSVGGPLPPGTLSANCTNYQSCKSCSSQPGCGWCAYLFECLPGNVNGSETGSCTDSWTVWTFEPSSCPLKSPFPSLCTSKPCNDCVKADYCGWCDSECIPGTSKDPYYGACTAWHFTACPVVLARNVWWLWAMLAFLLLSILTTVRFAIL